MAKRRNPGVADRATAYDAGRRTLKVRAVGNSLGTVWPREVLARLGAREGDELLIVDSPLGVLVMHGDPRRRKVIEAVQQVIAENRGALAALAKR
jgi:putative addiction module antidote